MKKSRIAFCVALSVVICSIWINPFAKHSLPRVPTVFASDGKSLDKFSPEADATRIAWSSSLVGIWQTVTNWTGGVVPSAAQIAQFAANPSGASVGINFNSPTNAGTQVNGQRVQEVGAIELASTRSNDLAVGNSSTMAGATGTLRLLGVTVNGIDNVILRNPSSKVLTIRDTQGSGNQTMALELGNVSENIIRTESTGFVVISSVITGTNRNLTLQGSTDGWLVLQAANTYSGVTKVSSGFLSIETAGSIKQSSAIELAGGVGFDVQSIPLGFTLQSGQILRATGSTSTATIFTTTGRPFTTATDTPIEFTNFKGTIAPLTISNTGAVLALQSGTPITVTVSNGGTPLPAGSYKLIAKAKNGTVNGTPAVVTLGGDGAVGSASLSNVSGELFLNIAAPPQTLVVNKTQDSNDGSCDTADCSLREAIAAAASGDSIAFSSLFGSPQTINLGSMLSISGKDLTIEGPGANLLTIDAASAGSRAISAVNSNFHLSGVKIQNGAATSSSGGAIAQSGGSLTLDSVYLTLNSATTGGAVDITNTGTANNIIRNSTFSLNTAADSCGGVRVLSGTTATIVNSTFSSNSANTGGGQNGGGLCVSGTATVTNSTFTGNNAGQGGGIYAAITGDLSIGSTIVAGNTAALAPEIFQQSDGNVVSNGYNLVGDSSGDAANTNSPIAYDAMTDIRDTDPQLGSLTNNGGPTPTHAIVTSSPAADKGAAFGQALDQRGQNRTVDQIAINDASDGTDIGSYEAPIGTTAAKVTISGRVMNVHGIGLSGVRVTLTGDFGEPRTALTNGFGYYIFDEVEVGKGYIVFTQDSRHRFKDQSRFVMLTDQLTDLDFLAEP